MLDSILNSPIVVPAIPTLATQNSATTSIQPIPTIAQKEYPYDLACIIGRFQFPHAGHTLLFHTAAQMAKKVLIIKGSSYQPRTIKNPFSETEITGMIISQFKEELPENSVYVHPVRDNLYSDSSWISQVQKGIKTYSIHSLFKGWEDKPENRSPKICMVGHKKIGDESTYYLKLFPQHELVTTSEFKLQLDATNLRELMFTNPEQLLSVGKHLMSRPTYDFIKHFTSAENEEYKRLVREYNVIKEYKDSWKNSPYPPTFVTVDAVVVKAGHILLVQRKYAPGEDLWALPGGFINSNESIEKAALRELNEETNIDLPPGLLKGSISKVQVFDHPDRSLRGRTITHAHLFLLDDHDKKQSLPKVRASDDAKDAKWFNLNDLKNMSRSIFEDHQSIITSLLGLE